LFFICLNHRQSKPNGELILERLAREYPPGRGLEVDFRRSQGFKEWILSYKDAVQSNGGLFRGPDSLMEFVLFNPTLELPGPTRLGIVELQILHDEHVCVIEANLRWPGESEWFVLFRRKPFSGLADPPGPWGPVVQAIVEAVFISEPQTP
jgi:hypothetical protein